MNGVSTCNAVEQAIEHTGTKAGRKGFECGTGAIKKVNLIRNIPLAKLVEVGKGHRV